jgi:tryptophan synthase beta chain
MDDVVYLPQEQMPQAWYNIQADLPKPLQPPLHPATLQPVGPEALAPIFPMELIKQEVSTERWIDIPEEVLEIYGRWRPTPLRRARALEEELGTPARIYYKDESVSPPGSHKPNTAVAQAYYNKKEGVRRLATETGAGQWGSALAFGTMLLGLECTVYMVRVSYEQKPFRKSLMGVWGADVYASPTELTEAGRNIRAQDPDCPGSLGIAISEAMEDAVKHEDTKYSLGSVLNHVLLHQTIIGLEAKKQMEMAGEYPDIVAGCVGGGSNMSGISFPFLLDKLQGKGDVRAVAVEPEACPTVTRGPYRYDFGDTAGMTPLLKMFTLGHTFIPPRIHAGGLRYHGMAPLVSLLCNEKVMEARACHQNPAFESAMLWARTQGVVPAPETAHAIHFVVEEARRCKESGEEKVILFNFSGHGHFDMAAYDAYLAGELEDYTYPQEEIEKALKSVPVVE